MLNTFLANIDRSLGLSKSSRFNVIITGGPSGLISGERTKDLSLLCEAAEMPGKSFITADAKTYGPIFKIPYQTQFQEVNLTFLCTSALRERRFFEAWMDKISNTAGSEFGTLRTFNFNFPSTYYGEVTIQNFRDDGSPDADPGRINYISLKEAYPISIASQPLNWADDGFLRLSVQFAYRYYSAIPSMAI